MTGEPSLPEAATGDPRSGASVPLSLRIAGDGESLASARGRVRQYLRERDVDESALYAVDLTLEEIAGNVFRHGCTGRKECEVRIDVSLTRSGVRVGIADDGQPFDPTLHPEPQIPRSLDDAPIGGRGISMVRRAVRAMRYHREAGWNRLEVEVARTTPSR